MLSYNSNYEESGEFVQYGPSKVGLTDCGLQCKVACGCNNSSYWYLTKPHSTHTTKAGTPVTSKYTSVTSEYEYDYIIGDDGNLASTGTTLSSAGRTLSGSSKTLSASSGEKVTCYKQVCSEGFTEGEPDPYYFNYETETLDDGSKCYKVTSCKCTESASDIGDTYFNYSCPTYNGKTCCNVTSCKYSPSDTYFKTSPDTACSKKCVMATDCQFGYTSWGTGTGATSNGITCKDVTCADEGTHDHSETWYDSTGGYSHYTTETSSYGNTCYTGRHNPSWYCTDSTYSYETSASAAPHASSAQKEQKCSTCGATTTGTCYAKGSHSYSCASGSSTNSSDFVVAWDDGEQTCTKSGCSETNGVPCYKEHTHGGYFCLSGDTDSSKFTCAVYDNTQICLYGSCTHRNSTKCYIEHTHGSYACPAGSSTDKSKFTNPISAGYQVCGYCSACTHTNSTECWKEGHVHSYSCSDSSYSTKSTDFTHAKDAGKQSCDCGETNDTTCYREATDSEHYGTCAADITSCGDGWKMVSYNRVCGTCGKVIEANGCNRCEELECASCDATGCETYYADRANCCKVCKAKPTWYTHSAGCGMVGASLEDCKVYVCVSGSSSSAWEWSGDCTTGVGGHSYDDAAQTCSGTVHSHFVTVSHPANKTQASCSLVYNAKCSEISINCSGSLTEK